MSRDADRKKRRRAEVVHPTPRDTPARKPLRWLGTSMDDYAGFPREIQHLAGQQLLLVQLGREPLHWKPMDIVGLGVAELRITTGQAHRVFYVAKFSEAIYILHVFEKKTTQTSQADINKGRARFSKISEERRKS